MTRDTVEIRVRLQRVDGLTFERTVVVERSSSGPTARGESLNRFRERSYRKGMETLHAVLGVHPDVTAK